MLRALPIALAALLAPACNGDQTAIRLRLSPTPHLNTEQQILKVVSSLTLSLDSPVGFRGSAEHGGSALSAKDLDGDGMLELTLEHALAGETSLPVFRISPGQNLDRVFQAAVRGTRASEVAAIGALESVRFYDGQVLDLMMPFDLRANHRPPRVVSTSPRDTQTGVPPALARIEVEFSKLVDEGSLPGELRVVYQGVAGARQLGRGRWEFRPLQIQELGLDAARTLAIFNVDPSCTLAGGTYRIEAATGIRDAAGVQLDQDANREGPDAYAGSFTIVAPGLPAQAEPCAGSVRPCQTDPECNPAGGNLFVCNTGKCIPSPLDCKALVCPKGYVCDPSPVGAARCVEDCRPTSFCGGKTDYCGEDGLCHPCTPTSTQPKCGNVVTEEVTCVFNGTSAMSSCKSVLGSCEGVGKCSASVSGLRGTQLTWTGPCGTAITTLDGLSETANFACDPGTIKEQVKCVFKNATTAQECYSARGTCKGIGSCLVDIVGVKGEKVDWKSSCGGYAITVIDGLAKYAEFDCGTPIKEDVQCQFVNATMENFCSSSKGSCKGLGSCNVIVQGLAGESVLWTSSCPGQVTTIMDGLPKAVKFYCK